MSLKNLFIRGCRHLNLRKITKSVFILSFLTSCATIPPAHFEDYAKGEWEGKLLVKNSMNDNSYILNLDITAALPESLRVDATTTLGIHLTTIVMDEGILSYILVRDKKFYEGKPNHDGLKPVLPISIDPRVIVDLLFDLDPREMGWKCLRDDDDYLIECYHSIHKLKVKWVKREGKERVIAITSSDSDLQLHLKNFKSKVEIDKNVFKVSIPKGFSQYKIN